MKSISHFLISIIIITVVSCQQNEKDTIPKKELCECQVLETFVKAAGQYQDITSNTDKANVIEGNGIVTSVSFDSVEKKLRLVIPTSVFKDKEYRYKEIIYDGSKEDFKSSLFLTQWCDIWYSYHSPESCLIPDSNRVDYNKSREALFQKYEGSKIESKDLPEKESVGNTETSSSENTSVTNTDVNKRACKDTVIQPSYYDWDEFSYIKLNNVNVHPLSSNRYSFCYKAGDSLKIKSITGEVLIIEF